MQLNGTTLAAIAALLTSLTGAIAWLMKALLAAKDEQIKSLATERDFYRDTAYGLLNDGERAERVADTATRRLLAPHGGAGTGAPSSTRSRREPR